MKIIGITGGVGSGKSEILNILKNDYQAKVIQSDHVAHERWYQGQKVMMRSFRHLEMKF